MICGKCSSNDKKKLFKEEESIKILKNLGLINNKWIYNYFKDKYGWRKYKSRI